MSNRTALLKSLSTNILLLQRTMRFARLNLNPPKELERLETILFTLIDALKNPTAGEFQNILGLNKSSISSLIKNLTDRGLIEAKLGVIDQRSKLLSISKESTDLKDRLRDFNIEVVRKAYVRLTDGQRFRLANLMERFITGLAYSREDEWDKREPIVGAQFRLALAMNMLNKSYMGTDYDLVTFHSFIELEKASEGLEFSSLTNKLPFHISKISRAITVLQKKKYVKKAISEKDGRQIILYFTDLGKKEYARIEDPILKRLEIACYDFTDTELEEYISLVKLVGDEAETYTNKSLSSFIIAKSESDYRLGRELLVEHLVTEKKHKYLDELLIPYSSLLALEVKDGKALSLMEIRFKDGQVKIDNLVEKEGADGESKKILLSEVKRVLMREVE